MGKRTIDKAEVVLSADSKRLISGLRKAEGGISKFALKATGLFAGMIGVRGLGGAVSSILQDADNLQNAANKIGLTTTALQEYRFAGEEVGVQSVTTDMALQRFIRRMGEAAQGGGELKGVLEQYNIAVRNSDGTTRSATAVIDDLADAVQGAESEQEQLRIAFKAFDSEGAALVSVLRQGSDGMDEMRAKASELGLVVREETVKELATLNREIEILGGRVTGFFTEKLGRVAMATNDLLIVLGAQAPKTLEQVDRSIARTTSILAAYQDRVSAGDDGFFSSFFGEDATEEIEKLNTELEGLQKIRDSLTQSDAEPLSFVPGLNDKDQKSFAAILKSVEDRTQSAISRILDLQGVSKSTIELSLISLQIENKLKQEGIKLSVEERNLLNQNLDLLGAKIDKVGDLTEASRAAQRASEAWTGALNQGLVDAIFRAQSFGDILDALGKRLLNNALFGLDGSGGLLGGITSSLGKSIGGLFSGFASGGTPPINSPFLVGEKGPEIMSFNRPMRVRNAHDTRMASGGGAPVINQTIHFDLVPAPTIQAMIDNAKPELAAAGAAGAMRVMTRGY